MTDDEIYDAAFREATGGDWQGWLTRQPVEVLRRLSFGLAHARDNTFVVRTDADYLEARSYPGRVVVRDENGIGGYYGWDDHCLNLTILDDVADTLNRRVAGVNGIDSCGG